MKTLSAKFERADSRVKLGGGWYLSSAAPLMQYTGVACGLLPSDVIYYRRRLAIVIRVKGRNVVLDRPIVVSRPQVNATPSVYQWTEITEVGK